ncbi:MAG TPA: Lrp/AsnC family transcriptional regulator [Bacteroidota bacterium]|jgi:Lrp/AsnC family leucine-responsive transcriptional regulator|nr:Lrp/AsnC family transcriptional regulator [Bacteroidota bacterium]
MPLLDDVDVTMLNALQANGRMRRGDLAELVGLSLPAVSDRLRKLEERGYITGYTAVLDARKFGKDVTAFVQVFVDTSRHYEEFLKHVKRHPDILECHAVTGEGSHLLKIRTDNTAALERVLSEIQSWKEVQRTLTSIVLSTCKETLNINIQSHTST